MVRPGRRSVTHIAAAVAALACGTVLQGTPQSDRKVADKTWVVGRTPDGQPDLQGVWTNYDPTPFERLSADEQRPREPAVSTADWLVQDSPISPRRPSMVVDPPNGRVPLKREAVERRDATLALDSGSLEHYGPWERCITRGVPGSMWPSAYNNGHKIVQTPGYVVLHSEMIHEARVIPLDGRPHLGADLRSWDGDSRGHWEGDTLVVDTTNFNGKGWIATHAAAGWLRGIRESDAAHTVERLTRVDENTIQYEATIDDPNVYTRPWKLAFPLNKDERYRIFEYACHEGNHALENMLRMGASR
ncbi:MAG TPA: hypothetical protein VF219_00540 [Vicinamibacterales bacterium]